MEVLSRPPGLGIPARATRFAVIPSRQQRPIGYPDPTQNIGQTHRARLIAKACTHPSETPEGAQQERWTYEQLGQTIGMSSSQAHTILARAEIKPHLTDYWIMSDFSQPEFEERRPSRTSCQRPGGRPAASTNTHATARSACSRA